MDRAGLGLDEPSTHALIPPLQVQGSVDGSTWDPLGSFMPVGNLARSGQTLTVSAGTYFWENPAGRLAYTEVRVLASTLASAPVVLSSMTAPTTSVTVSATANASNTATPEPNGVDQSQLLLQVNTGGASLPTSDPSCQSVYYRDEADDLVTNLSASPRTTTFSEYCHCPGPTPTAA